MNLCKMEANTGKYNSQVWQKTSTEKIQWHPKTYSFYQHESESVLEIYLNNYGDKR